MAIGEQSVVARRVAPNIAIPEYSADFDLLPNTKGAAGGESGASDLIDRLKSDYLLFYHTSPPFSMTANRSGGAVGGALRK